MSVMGLNRKFVFFLRIISFFFLLQACFVKLSWALRFKLPSGEEVEGKLLEETETSYYLETSKGIINLPKNPGASKPAASKTKIPSPATKTSPVKTQSPAIRIEGTRPFQNQIAAALELLSKKARSDFEFVKKYVGKIRQNERSGMFWYENPPAIQISDRTAMTSLTWCASVLVHETCHAQYFLTSESKDRPLDAQHQELSCNQIQLSALRKIGGPASEIKYLSNLDGMHFDTNHDGQFTEEDYKLRNW